MALFAPLFAPLLAHPNGKTRESVFNSFVLATVEPHGRVPVFKASSRSIGRKPRTGLLSAKASKGRLRQAALTSATTTTGADLPSHTWHQPRAAVLRRCRERKFRRAKTRLRRERSVSRQTKWRLRNAGQN